MAFWEVRVIEVREVLRAWLSGAGLRVVAERAGVDRKTARRYVEAAQEAGLTRDGGDDQLTDGLLGEVVERVRPVRPSGRGGSWQALEAQREQITEWVAAGLSVVKVGVKLERIGVVVPYRTLHRFCVERCGFGRTATTTRVADGEPGAELQIDFARMGLVNDAARGRRRVCHALILTAVFSRHMFVWLTFSQTLDAVISGCEAAWAYFGGVFKVVIPDNMAAIVADADPVNPRFTAGWLDYAQHCGFGTDATRVRHPRDKPRVERMVQYVRGNFFAGESFLDLADAQTRARSWCSTTAGQRMHGTIQARPLEVFTEAEAPALLALPDKAYDVPIFTKVKVHKDFHVEIAKALYSAPSQLVGQRLEVRADSVLVKLFHHGRLVKVHPRQRPGGRWTDPADLPSQTSGYAMRDLDSLVRAARRHGHHVGIYAERLLRVDLPWTRMRQAYRLLGLVRRYGPGPVETACAKALEVDVVSVSKIASMLEKAIETTPTLSPRQAAGGPTRFARDPSEFSNRRLIVLRGGQDPDLPGVAGGCEHDSSEQDGEPQ
ncbi:IS21 family transposase [Saccharopolyspora sp. ASAGF58]|uniref:IS21 family transposase n=1 Tax=Saccharopolyspora sp. ASAGF58 TaxID=2719023 RepID=UPI001FF0B382|nr:IS21 family transposase [Saccharopolyspora sp. ASAGF58]